jgi:hypothetical protein
MEFERVEVIVEADAQEAFGFLEDGASGVYLFDPIEKIDVIDHRTGGYGIFHMKGGLSFKEYYTVNDRERLIYQYFIPELPAGLLSMVVGTVYLKDLGNGKTHITWTSSYLPRDLENKDAAIKAAYPTYEKAALRLGRLAMYGRENFKKEV